MGKLLIVDDDQALRRLMHLELSDSYEVIDTGEPEHGLALALEHRPDAILLDLRMPKYSGYALCQTCTWCPGETSTGAKQRSCIRTSRRRRSIVTDAGSQ